MTHSIMPFFVGVLTVRFSFPNVQIPIEESPKMLRLSQIYEITATVPQAVRERAHWGDLLHKPAAGRIGEG